MFKTFFAAVAISLASLGMASAATVTQSATPGAAFANPLATSFTGVIAENVTGPDLISGQRRSPWQGTSVVDGVFSAVTGTATYAFGSVRTMFSFVWGSPDNYNDLDFYLTSGANPVFTVNGASILPCCGGNIPNSLVTISGLQFDKVVFRSTTAAFEYANIAAVPLPAGGLLLIGALGGLAALRRRKARTA